MVPSTATIRNPIISRRTVDVGKSIGSVLLRNYEAAFATQLGEDSLVNVGYNEMGETFRRSLVTKSTLIDDNIIKFTLLGVGLSVMWTGIDHGKIQGCLQVRSTRLCLGMIVFATPDFIADTNVYADCQSVGNHRCGDLRDALEGTPSRDVNAASLNGCNNNPLTIDHIPQCVGSIIHQVNEMMSEATGEGDAQRRTIISVAVQFIKFGPLIESHSLQFAEHETLYLYNQYYYVGIMPYFRDFPGSVINDQRVWIKIHSGIYSGLVTEQDINEWSSSENAPGIPVALSPAPVFASTGSARFVVTLGDRRSSAIGCWVAKTDDFRSTRLVQFCLSMMMFHLPTETFQREWATVSVQYGTLEQAVAQSPMGTSPSEHSLVDDEGFLKQLNECGIEYFGCLGIVASKVFSLVTLRNASAKQSVGGIYIREFKANLIERENLSSGDQEILVSRGGAAFFTHDYQGRAIRHLSTSAYFAFHLSEQLRGEYNGQAFSQETLQGTSAAFKDQLPDYLRHLFGSDPLNRIDSPGWVEERGNTVVTFENKINRVRNGLQFAYNPESLIGSINGCFDSDLAGLRICLVLQIFQRRFSAIPTSGAYVVAATPQEAVRSAPHSTAANNIVIDYSDSRMKDVRGPIRYSGHFTPIDVDRLIGDWLTVMCPDGDDGPQSYIDSINVVGLQVGVSLNETHFAPRHFVNVAGVYVYRTSAPEDDLDEDGF